MCLEKIVSFSVGTGPTAAMIYSLFKVMNASQSVKCRNEPFCFRYLVVAITEHILRLEIFLYGMYYYAIFIKDEGTKTPTIMTSWLLNFSNNIVRVKGVSFSLF